MPEFRRLLESPFYLDLEDRLAEGRGRVELSGLVEASRALVLTLLASRLRTGVLLVVPDDAALGKWHRDLAAMAGLTGRDPLRIVDFPAMDADPYDDIAPHPEVVRERVVALQRIVIDDLDFLLAPARALFGRLPSRQEWERSVTRIRVGDDLPPDRFILSMIGYGFRRVDTVSGPGEISRRGGIIDLYQSGAHEPVRIELFGDSVDSLRTFDTDHQRSTGRIDSLTVGPAMESPPTEQAVARVAKYLEEGKGGTPFRQKLEALAEEGYFPGFETLACLTAECPVDLFDYTGRMLTVIDEPEQVNDEILRADYDNRSCWKQSGNRTLPPPERMYVEPKTVQARLAAGRLAVRELVGEEPIAEGTVIYAVSRSARSYAGRIQELAADIEAAGSGRSRTLCVMRSEGAGIRLQEILGEYGIPFSEDLILKEGSLRAGFELPDIGLTVLTETEIFGGQKKASLRKPRGRAAFLSDFRDLKEGDLVVHVDHGIASYAGLGRPKGGSLNRDFMILVFSRGDRLFVPVDRLDLVQKYSGVAGKKPPVDRLGGVGWARVKSRAKKSVEFMARELLALYARRKSIKGHSFPEDTPWQAEMEDGFTWEETPDQGQAIREVKRDMESDLPMDRLLVGDVGFGKTEVAVRAAFKAVMDGKQAAVLAPTTVLSYQHFKTIQQRYAAFPVKVELVSRFRSASDIRQVLDQVAGGAVDVLIGTHRMLSRDVRFRDLGLLVIDEEQRFGVAHKEKLKEISIGVDVLSMTATPIPRTLQMSLAGVRDLSMIETPPPGRMAIQTRILPWRTGVLAQAIRQEIRRGGQVFLVHNRIETLPALVRAAREMVPEARIAMAHGRMREHQLEQVMMQFVNHEVDILVTTTIIENGLDIPRANTIIVNRADRFGLAQLYQLRGRVGRSEKHAYAYFLVPGREAITEIARKRLRALQEFGELGAGFRLAAADLEIRGAGELLGPKQHGNIAALGFDLYCQMLERAVAELEGEPATEREPVSLHLGVDIKLPESYLSDAGVRLALYKRLAGMTDEEEVGRYQAETEDRYGRFPATGRNLFDMAKLRILMETTGAKRVDVAEGKLQIRFRPDAALDPERIVNLFRKEKGSLTPSGLLIVPAPSRATDRISAVRDILKKIMTTKGDRG